MRTSNRFQMHGRSLALLVLSLTLLPLAACDGDDDDDDGGTDADSDADTDADTDTDTDSDTDLADCSACTAEICFNRIEGKVVTEGAAAPLTVQICAPSCASATVEDDGSYFLNFTATCMEYPFASDEKIHVSFWESMDGNTDTHTRYTYGFDPTDDDYVVDHTLGIVDLPRLELPATGVEYTAAGGANVDDLNGVSIDLAAGQLGDEDALVRVFEHPLGGDTPPFVPADIELDALFYLAPYFYGETPFTVEIDAAILGWADGFEGVVYQLGDYAEGSFLDCPGGDDHMELGHFGECGTATVSGGVVTIADVPLLGWIGLGPAE